MNIEETYRGLLVLWGKFDAAKERGVFIDDNDIEVVKEAMNILKYINELNKRNSY